MKILGLIPARGGSERVKNKNIRLLGNKPLLAYTIEAALQSKRLDKVIVSTNSPEIASIAQEFEAEVPFLRPNEISLSHSTELEFHLHAIAELESSQNYIPDLIVNLYPTCPFRTSNSIDSAINLINTDNSADSLRSVKLCTEHPYKMWQIYNSHLKRFININNIDSQTLSYQLLPKVFIQNASIYISRLSTIKGKSSTIGDTVLAFVMDEFESIDINNELDFILAEAIIKSRIL